jgi:hypothetical protein
MAPPSVANSHKTESMTMRPMHYRKSAGLSFTSCMGVAHLSSQRAKELNLRCDEKLPFGGSRHYALHDL